MKKTICLFLCLLLVLNGCSKNDFSSKENNTQTESKSVITDEYSTRADAEYSTESDAVYDMESFGDEKLLSEVESAVYTEMEEEFASDDYEIEGVSAIYLSKEYVDELKYNSKSNIWFGYSLEEVKAQFGGTPFVFTLGEDGDTTVTEMESAEDIYGTVLKNVAIGTGVILFCVTVSAIAAPASPAIGFIFSCAMKGATIRSLQGAVGGIGVGLVNYAITGDLKQASKAALLASSEGYKYGAIFGSIEGAAGGAYSLYSASKNATYTPKDAEIKSLKKFGGDEQKTFLNGKEVEYGTANASRPDQVRKLGDAYEAMEVKYYDLENNYSGLKSTLKRQILERNTNLPSGYKQGIVLDVTNRGYSKTFLNYIENDLREYLNPVYKDIPIYIIK